jgi:hypothetical protein
MALGRPRVAIYALLNIIYIMRSMTDTVRVTTWLRPATPHVKPPGR